MNKKIKEITSDAIFVALITVIILIFKYALFYIDTMLLLIISIMLGVRYFKEKYQRLFIVSLSIILISFLYFDIESILVFIIPGIIIGNLAHFLLKILLNLPYYILTILTYFLSHSIVEIIYAYLILDLNFKDYLYTGMGFPEQITKNMGINGLIIVFLAFNLIMSMMEAFIIRKSVFIYYIKKKKIKGENK